MDAPVIVGRVALPRERCDGIRALVREHGEQRAAQLLHVHPQTLARGAAGLGLNRSTAELIERRLAELAAGRRRG